MSATAAITGDNKALGAEPHRSPRGRWTARCLGIVLLALSVSQTAAARPQAEKCPCAPAAEATLQRFFVRQLTDASCSVAVLTTIANAARDLEHMAPLSQGQMLALEPTGRWRRATAPNGDGVSLEELAALARVVLPAAGLRGVTVETIKVLGQNGVILSRLLSALAALAQDPTRVFLAANFWQEAFLDDGGAVGHHALVASFDVRQRLATIYDVDPEVTATYQVPWPRFVAGMAPQQAGGTARGLMVVRVQGF